MKGKSRHQLRSIAKKGLIVAPIGINTFKELEERRKRKTLKGRVKHAGKLRKSFAKGTAHAALDFYDGYVKPNM